jgi:hypothetical protein
MAIKNNVNVAALLSALMGEIFDITATVFDTIELVQAVAPSVSNSDNGAKYDFATNAYISSGQASREFRDKLNYSAFVVDYGLAELFAGILAATATVQSAGAAFSSRGDVSIYGSTIKSIFSGEDKEAATPSLAIQEAIYDIQLGASAAEFAGWAVQFGFNIKAKVDAAKNLRKPIIEAI